MSSSTSHSIAAEADSARDDLVAAVTESLQSINFDDTPAADMIDMVDTTAKLSKMLDTLDGLPTEPPSLYFDLEGENLSRHGSVSILQLHVLPSSRTYLVDVHTLQHTAFSTCGGNGRTLRELLECDGIPKVFFDVRNDSDALYSHFNIRLARIQDLQLMELATRTFSKKYITGLSKCIERDACLPAAELITWKAVKDAGVKLFAPDYDGSYTVFAKRPLCDAIKLYYAQDAQILPRLWSQYNARMAPAWARKVHETSKERVTLSQTATFNGKGRHMALAPPGWH
ncbi:ribonuclease H-like domain-containing protein [Chaetomium tenue]|uniref:Ribonuclease H-like domain-containing protein n=1 Tax=Chaetomium tenue TaxID=1854479 RepID=A0ACB7P128_9PEZI|nr:ribonuclease H-like domain-containing protein [Chaetomium globosum]